MTRYAMPQKAIPRKKMPIDFSGTPIKQLQVKGLDPRFNNITNAPEFPGQQSGASVQAVRDFVKQQVRVKGYNITVDAAGATQDIILSGDARLLVGFAFVVDPARLAANTLPSSMSLTINEEIVISQVAPKFYLKDFTEDMYYPFTRPLSGTDQIKLSFLSSGAAQDVGVAFYYI